jgi:hypothetical protein
LIAVVSVFGFADALSQWQFNQDFKVTDNYVGIGEGMGPRVAMSNSGNSIIVWVEDNHALYYQLMDQNNYHIGISVLVNADAIPGGYSINVGMNSTGDFSVVWANRQTSDIFLKRFESNGNPLGAEAKVNENGIVNEYDFPLDYAMNDDGNSVIVWENNNDGYKNIYGQYYNSDGTPRGDNFPVTDDPSSAENAPAVAMDGQGNFVIVWIDFTGDNSKLYGKRYDSSCNALGAKFLIDEWQRFSDYDDFPSIAMNEQGYFLVCWHKKDQAGQRNLHGLLYNSQGDLTGIQYQVNNISSFDRIDAVLFNDNSSILVWGATNYQRFASDGSPIDGTETAKVEPYSASSACIAGNDAKNYNMIWFSTIYTISQSYFIYSQQFFSDGKRNGPNILIDRKIVSEVRRYYPALACNNPGKFVITWDDNRNESDWTDVYAQILGSNGKFIRDNFAVIIKAYTDRDPEVALRDDGSFIVLWKDDAKCAPDEEFNLYAKWYDPDWIPSKKFKVNDVDCSVYFYMPKVEISPTGSFIIVWTDQRDTWKNGKIRCQMYDANSNPIGANFEINDPVERNIKCEKPSLGIDANGNFIVVWETDLNGYRDNWDIYGKIFHSDGSPYQANFMINDDGGSSDQFHPAVDMLADGSFVVTWNDTREGNNDIFAQRYDSNWNPIGNNFIVNDGGLTSRQFNPSIAFTADGKFVIAWQDARNRNDDIYAQKFDADGNKIGGNYRVSDDDGAAIQSNPQVDCSGENIYFTWQDNRIPNEKDNIFARVEPFSGVQHWIDIKQPKAGDKWFINQAQQIKWTCSALGGTVKIELSTDYGNSWKTLTSDIAYDAADFDCTPIASEISDECLIKISSNDHPGISDLSDRFNIFKPTKNYVAKQFFNSLDPITLDGNLTEPIWSEVKAESLLCGGEPEQWTANWTDFAYLMVTWKAIWSPENNRVYAGIEIADDVRGTLDNNDPQESPFYPFNDESLELYVDGDHSGGFFQGSCLSAQQWLITTENKRILNYYNIAGKFGVYFGNAIQTAVTLGGNGNWVIEAELVIINHFETAARTLAPGDTIGWDVWYNDSDNDAYENGKYVRDHQTGWYYTEQAYENADPFGNLILSDIVVPVELYSFEAFVTDDRVQLKWQTASESSNYGFEVQRSNNGINFEKISFVPGSGTTNSSRSYTFHDKNVSQSMNYYRLKILDYDGNYSFSSIVQVCLSQPKRFHLYANYPNPFNPETTITYDLADAKLVVIKIYNLSGKEVATLLNEHQKPGSYSILWNARSVPSGIYLCRMKAGSYRESFKLTILK